MVQHDRPHLRLRGHAPRPQLLYPLAAVHLPRPRVPHLRRERPPGAAAAAAAVVDKRVPSRRRCQKTSKSTKRECGMRMWGHAMVHARAQVLELFDLSARTVAQYRAKNVSNPNHASSFMHAASLAALAPRSRTRAARSEHRGARTVDGAGSCLRHTYIRGYVRGTRSSL